MSRPGESGLWPVGLFTNAVEHGNLGITYIDKTLLNNSGAWLQEVNRRLLLAENINKYVLVNFVRKDNAIHIAIIDQGDGFDWMEYLSISRERIYDKHGRGIAMSRLLSLDALEFNDKGNQVTAENALAKRPGDNVVSFDKARSGTTNLIC